MMLRRVRDYRARRRRREFVVGFGGLGGPERRFVLDTLRLWCECPRRWWFVEEVGKAVVIGG
jgi:hypothetical protein